MIHRASFSTLNTWASGNYDRAVQMYFKLGQFTTQAMAEGKIWHQKWADEVEKTQSMPKIFGGRKLTNPKTEVKIVKNLEPWLDLVGVIDLVEGDTLYDWKSGKSNSGDYVNSFQAKVYQILLPKSKRFEFHHFDPLTKKTDMSIVYLSPQTLREGLEWVVTLASEFHDYLSENKLYERYL